MGCVRSKHKRKKTSNEQEISENIQKQSVKDVSVTSTPKSIRKEKSHVDLINDELLLETKDEPNFVVIQVDDSEAFNESFIRQCQQVIDNQTYRSIIESWSPDSLEQLTELIKNFTQNKSSIDCYWIIFYWIACNISYDTVSYFSKNYADQTAEGVFRNKKGVCAGYANIYKYFCDQLNIYCEIVSGFSKGYGFDDRDDPLSDTDHAWNVIEIDKHKYLIESTWAAGHLTDKKVFERKLNTYYFCPRPNEMIYHHLPEIDKWQLLKMPVSKIQFLQMPKIHPLYFELHFELLYPRHQGYIELLPHKSYALVLVKVPDNVRITADLKLDDKIIPGGHRIIYNKEKQIYYCYFAPNTIGKHKITLYGKRTETEGNTFGAAVELTLLINETLKAPISFPSTWDRFFDFNLNIISPKNTHLITLDNKAYAEILISTPDDVELIGQLVNSNETKVIGGDQVYLDREKNLWRCQFAPNAPGRYTAEIMAKKKSDSGSFTSAVSFTLDTKSVPLLPMSFPKTWQIFHDLQLVVEARPRRAKAIGTENATFTEILISTPDDVELLGQLVNSNGEKIIGGEQVYFDREKNLWQCRFALDASGKYTAEIMAKKKSDSGSFTSAVSFTLDAKSVPSPPLSFPKTWQIFHDLQLVVEAPRHRAKAIWPENASFTEILISTPDDVELLGQLVNSDETKIVGGDQVYFDRKKKLWRCHFAPNASGEYTVEIMAKKKSETTLYTSAVSFTLDAKSVPSPPLSFPKTWQLFHDLDLQIISPQNSATIPWNETASYSEIRMLAPDHIRLTCTMKCNDITEKNSTLAQFDHEKQQWQLLFAPQQTGVYELNVFARQLSSNDKSLTVARFELNVTKLERTFTFPLLYKQFQDSRCQIYEPFNGVLKKDSTILIHCYVPDAIDVDIQVDSKWLDKKDYKNSILKTEITVGSVDVKIYAKFKEDADFNGVISYSVE